MTDKTHPLIKQIRDRDKGAEPSVQSTDTVKFKKRWQGKRHSSEVPVAEDEKTKQFVSYITKAPLRTEQDKRNRRLIELAEIEEKLRGGRHVQNRTLQTWLTAEEYAQLDEMWEEQKRIRSGSKLKPEAVKHYERQLKRAQFYDSKAQGERERHQLGAAAVSQVACDALLKTMLHELHDKILTDNTIESWLDRTVPHSVDAVDLSAMPRSITSNSPAVRVKRLSKADIKIAVVSQAIQRLMS